MPKLPLAGDLHQRLHRVPRPGAVPDNAAADETGELDFDADSFLPGVQEGVVYASMYREAVSGLD